MNEELKENSKKYKTLKFDIRSEFVSTSAITLISLVITIIILIILAGLTINLSIGKNGIFNKTKDAKEKYEIAQIREKVEIELINIEIERLDKAPLTIEEALQEMLERKTFESIDKVEHIGNIGEYEVKLKYDENNKIVIEYIEKATGVRVTYKLNPEGYTNKAEVEIILKVKGNIKQITKPDGEVLTENEITEELKYKVTSNGTYKFTVEDEQENIKEKEVIVDTIDMLEPKDFEIEAEEIKSEEGGLKITANAEDAEADETSVKSGIGRYEYYVKLATESEYTKYDTNEIKGLPIGTYKVYAIAYDKAENPKQSKNEVEVKIEEWTEIWNEEDLRNIANDLTKNYILMDDIELKSEWTPIGSTSNVFKGKLDGDKHKITGLIINASEADNQGLFGCLATTALVTNLNVECNITARNYVGGIAGINYGIIDNIEISGIINAEQIVGGVVSQNLDSGIVRYSCSKVTIEALRCAGGVAGTNYGRIASTVSSGTVTTKAESAGGLVGQNIGGSISYSASNSIVSGSYCIGGLVGISMVDNSLTRNSTIINSYSEGEVKTTMNSYSGGLVGRLYNQSKTYKAQVINSYTISKVLNIGERTSEYVGGLVGEVTNGTITNSYWSKEASGQETSAGGTVLTLDQMKTQSSYQNWDFTSGTIWKMGEEYPELVFKFK